MGVEAAGSPSVQQQPPPEPPPPPPPPPQEAQAPAPQQAPAEQAPAPAQQQQQPQPQAPSAVDQNQNVRNARGESNFEAAPASSRYGSSMPSLMLKQNDPVPFPQGQPTTQAEPPSRPQGVPPASGNPVAMPQGEETAQPPKPPQGVPPASGNPVAMPQGEPTGVDPASSTQRVNGPPPTIDAVVDKLKAGDTSDATRTMINEHFKPLSMADSKASMDRIRQEQLLPQFIDAAARDVNGKPVTPEVKAGLTTLFNTGRLDVYAETLSSTPITVGTFVDAKGNPALQYNGPQKGIELDKRALAGQSNQDVANILAHEMFHAFSDAHGGQGYTALDEGLGIAAREYAFSDKDYNLSEMVYGTKNFYRDYRNEPDYRLGDFSKADPKLKELVKAFTSRDYSHLAWNDPTQFQSDYKQFWQPLDRKRTDWNDAATTATSQMLAGRPT